MLRAPRPREPAVAGVQLFQVDERVAPDGDPNRNLTHLRECLSSRIAALPPSSLHAMPVDAPDLEAAAATRYARRT